MLKSTYKPTAVVIQPLPSGWTEHKAPTGHTYYYNVITKESTYKRPEPSITASQPVGPSLGDPNVANAYIAQFNQPAQTNQRGGYAGRGRGGYEGRPKPQPVDKPKKSEPIPGHEPWLLIYTKYCRRFVYNPEKNTSYWRIPEKLMPGILELDKARIRGKADAEKPKEKSTAPGPSERPSAAKATKEDEADSSEYEEVEVTDDEDENENPSKRQRTDEPLEFTEDDIAAQLAAMGEDYGLDPGDYDDGNTDLWPEGTEGVPFSEDDAKLLFKDLLSDLGINPYGSWEQLLEDGKIVEDARYTALNTTKARKDCWDEWTRERIAALKEERARQEKADPKVAYMAFLGEKATPRLFWAEFKRKFKKEGVMRDLAVPEKEKEKIYRDFVARLKQPLSNRKAELTTLLKSLPLQVLNNQSLSRGLPKELLADARYGVVEGGVKDGLVEAYVQSLAGPPSLEDVEVSEERARRERTDRAIKEREKRVEVERKGREEEVGRARGRLEQGEREIEGARRIGLGGLRSQLFEKGKEDVEMGED